LNQRVAFQGALSVGGEEFLAGEWTGGGRGGRERVFNAIVEPERESVLIGAIVLEELGFLVDCPGQRLVPRDPKQIVSEAE
jgi:hypothetical protein